MDSFEEYKEAYEESGILVYTLAIPMVLIGLVLNVNTLIVIFKQKSIRNHPLVPLIFYITLTDLLIYIYSLPVHALSIYKKHWIFVTKNVNNEEDAENDLICKISFLPIMNAWTMSYILLAIVSVNRGLALLYGKDFALRKFNWKNMFIIFFFVSTS